VLGILSIGLVAILAGFMPARRAAGVDPARALRRE
jgi:ABC-type antimicrobial peptide transport system permease subunit